jgi:hypothetical protein
MDQIDMNTLWYQTSLDVFLNRWFSNYEDARRDRESVGGYLLPYKHHFYVCKAEVIQAMGVDPDDSDWEKIKWDCAQPADADAHQRLCEKRASVLLKNNP